MAISYIFRFIFLTSLIYWHCKAFPVDSDEDPFQSQIWKRASLRKLRPNNPLLIYQQSIRQAKSLPSGKEISFKIPRRWIRHGTNVHFPFLIWNHQLLPRFPYKNQPTPNLLSLRKTGISDLNVEPKRSGDLSKNLEHQEDVEGDYEIDEKYVTGFETPEMSPTYY